MNPRVDHQRIHVLIVLDSIGTSSERRDELGVPQGRPGGGRHSVDVATFPRRRWRPHRSPGFGGRPQKPRCVLVSAGESLQSQGHGSRITRAAGCFQSFGAGGPRTWAGPRRVPARPGPRRTEVPVGSRRGTSGRNSPHRCDDSKSFGLGDPLFTAAPGPVAEAVSSGVGVGGSARGGPGMAARARSIRRRGPSVADRPARVDPSIDRDVRAGFIADADRKRRARRTGTCRPGSGRRPRRRHDLRPRHQRPGRTPRP